MLLRRAFMQAGLLVAVPAFADPGLRFPRDFGAHNETALEWWYLTGILNDAANVPRYGYQLTFFRLMGPVTADHPSPFAARQMLLGHAALSDLSAGRLRHDQRTARTGFNLAEASSADTEVHLRDWSLRRTADGYSARLRSPAQSFALDLQLKTSQPVLLQGAGGLSRKGPQPGQFSHYYSQAQLLTQARLEVDGKSRGLQGKSWLDHEWSDQLLGVAGPDQAVGWDWAGLNLDDGGALTIFRLRRADGSVLWAGGSWRKPNGSTQDFKPADVVMTPLRSWLSPTSQASYPVEWSLQTPLGALTLKALIDAQEIDARMSTGMRYWEGAAELRGADGKPLGRGYLELTGYAGPGEGQQHGR